MILSCCTETFNQNSARQIFMNRHNRQASLQNENRFQESSLILYGVFRVSYLIEIVDENLRLIDDICVLRSRRDLKPVWKVDKQTGKT